MRFDELIESLEEINDETPHHIWVTIVSEEPRQFEIKADEKANLDKLQKIQQLLCQWQRSGVKRYRVRLLGFNSSHGKQYLSCEHDIHGKVFACAPNHFLKQTFTWDELNQLINDTRFKGIAYFDQLLRTGIEEVKDDEADLIGYPELYEDGEHEITCEDCGKEFKVETMVSYDWETHKMEEE